MLVVGAAAWAGAAAGSVAPHCPPGAAGLAAALSVLAATRRHRAATRAPSRLASMLLHLAVFLGLAGLASLERPAAPPELRGGRLRGTVADVRHRPNALEIVLRASGRSRSELRVRVPLTGDARLDALDPSVLPGARVETLARVPDPRRARAVAPCASAVRPLGAARGAAWWASFPDRTRYRFRRRAARALAGLADQKSAGLAVALVTGDRDRLDTAVRASLRRSGLMHLFVVSGLHVGWIVAAATLLFTRLSGREHPARAACVALAALAALTLLPGSAPVRRAAGALVLAQLGALAGRATPPGTALGAVALALLVLDPALATSWSFGLTVTATAAILLAGERAAPPRLRLAVLLAAPAAATWAPLVVMTGRLAPWGAAFTLPALPATVGTLAAGWLATAAGGGEGPVGGPAAAATGAMAGLTRRLVGLVAELPWSGRIAMPSGWLWCGLCQTALLVALVARRRRVMLAAAAAFVALALWPLRPPPPAPSSSEVGVVDVGQGQAVLVREARTAVLVDAGDDRSRRGTARLVEVLAAAGLRSLDALVVTHADRDHAGGAEEMLAAAPPRLVVLPEGIAGRDALRPLVVGAARRGIPIRPLRAGDVLRVGGIELVVWHPLAGDARRSNDASLVLYARLARLTAWLPGDAGAEAEAEWLRDRPPPRVDVLVAGHHGSRGATTRALLRRLRPRVVLVSCGGENRYGHPHAETLERVREAGARVFVTEGRGDLLVRRDGRRLVVERGLPP